jgi:hypothetical protein
MLVIMADGHDDPLELSARRDRFTCEGFSYSIADDGKSGFVVLLPQWRPLMVSGSSLGYVRIRVINSEGKLVGSMTCSGDSRVSWSTAAMG